LTAPDAEPGAPAAPPAGPERRRPPRVPPDETTGAFRVMFRTAAFSAYALMAFKAFVCDVSNVTTRSMEPTIVGRENGGDGVLLDRTAYLFDEPRRFDVPFFRYWNNREILYIKRIVGMPGEQLAIMDGDLWLVDADWTGPVEEAAATGRAKPVRRPPHLERLAFERRPVILPGEEGRFGRLAFDRLFETKPEERECFSEAPDRGTRVKPPAGAEVLARFRRPITDYLPDAADLRAGSMAPGAGTGGDFPVSDVAVQFDVSASPGAEVLLALDDPRSGVRHLARFRFLPRGGEGTVAPKSGSKAIPTGSSLRTPATDSCAGGTSDCASNSSTASCARSSTTSKPRTSTSPTARPSPARRGGVYFGARGGAVVFDRPRIERDLHYVADGQTRFLVPPDSYLCLGDHPADSSDGRHWRVTMIEDLRTGEVLEGDADGMRHRSSRNDGRNPRRRDDGKDEFTDKDENVRVFRSESEWRRLGTYHTPFLPRSLIVGRATWVVWPPARAGAVR
jgi:signal peptidase I